METMPRTFREPGRRSPIEPRLPSAEVEHAVMSQLNVAAAQPAVGPDAAVMPDCHPSYDGTIGCVFLTRDAVVPTAVGLDIACGVCADATGQEFDPARTHGRFWNRWVEREREDVPAAFGVHRRPQRWDGPDVRMPASALQPLMRQKVAVPLGTLGGGNRFMEAQVDETNERWLMVQSGSRHLGFQIANDYTANGQELTAKRGEMCL